MQRKTFVIAAAAFAATSGLAFAADEFKISLGVREAATAIGQPIGANGGTAGAIEWINKDVPTLTFDGSWQTFSYNFGTDPVSSFTGDGTITQAQSVLEHIRILNSGAVGDIIKVWIDDVTATAPGGSPVQITGFEGLPAPGVQGGVMFRQPRFSGSTNGNLTTAADVAVVDDTIAVEGTQSYRLEFQFKSNNTAEWIRLTTFAAPTLPNPVIPTAPGSNVSFKMRAIVVEPATRWGVDNSGNWSDSANWLLDTGVTVVPGTDPVSNTAVANFLTVATAPATVNVDVPIRLNTLRLKNASGYTFNSTDPNTNIITLTGPTQFTANINAEVGSHTINAPINLELLALATNVSQASSVLTLAGGVNFDSLGLGSGVSMIKTGDGRVDIPQIRSYVIAPDDSPTNPTPINPSHTLTVSGGTVKLMPHGANPLKVSLANRISVAGGATPTAKLDVSDNAFVVDYVDPSIGGVSTRATLEGQIKAGYNGGNWAGLGITSSSAAALAGGAVGIAEATDIGSPATFLGETIDTSAVLIRFTRSGDANLSGGVDLDDFTVLAGNFGLAGRWATGDFNYDGTVNLDDFTALAGNFGLSVPADVARSEVPEPGMLSVLGLAAAGLVARRRRA